MNTRAILNRIEEKMNKLVRQDVSMERIDEALTDIIKDLSQEQAAAIVKALKEKQS